MPEEQPDHDILTFGGIALIRSLMTVGLIDEFRLQVHPVLAGSGPACSTTRSAGEADSSPRSSWSAAGLLILLARHTRHRRVAGARP